MGDEPDGSQVVMLRQKMKRLFEPLAFLEDYLFLRGSPVMIWQ